MQPLLSQVHIDYVLNDFACDRNRLEYLFGLLELIDPFERRWFLPSRLGEHSFLGDGESVEDQLAQQYGDFKATLTGYLDSRIRECSVVFMYVSETLNLLRRLGCPVEARKRALRIRETLEAINEFESQLLNPATRDTVLAKLEEMLANARAETQLFQGRYELFCSQIARRLIRDRMSDEMENAD